MPPIIISSCPGKILLIGGYTVLDKVNPGLVIATSARMRASLKWETEVPSTTGKISVYSKAFGEMYSFEYDSDGTVTSSPDTPQNAFVDAAIRCSLLWISRCLQFPQETPENDEKPPQPIPLRTINLIIDADAQFHLPLSDDTSTQIKTGLGSSAALTASLVGALLLHFYTNNPLDRFLITEANGAHLLFCANASVRPKRLREEMHFVAQCAHSLAQKKIGSGFDICCAVFGSGVYHRYSRDLLQDCVFSTEGKPSAEILSLFDRFCAEGLRDTTDTTEDMEGQTGSNASEEKRDQSFFDYTFEPLCPSEIDPLCTPPPPNPQARPLQVLLIASRESTSTTGMVKSFAQSREAFGDLTDSLVYANHEFIRLWREMAQDDDHSDGRRGEMQRNFRLIRCYLKHMGKIAEIPIEPDSSTRILNRVQEMEGVVCAGCPGAGGYDAMCIFVQQREQCEAVAAFVQEAYGETHVPVRVDMDERCGLVFDFLKVGE